MGGCLESVDNRDGNDFKDEESRREARRIEQDYHLVPRDHHVGKIWNHFSKDAVLGRGASCRVLSVTRKSDRRKFALKEMLKSDGFNIERFPAEVQILAELDHPNILEFSEAWIDNNNFIICTKLCQGGALIDRVKKKKNFSENIAAKLVRSIVEALHYAHSRGIVHRDIKPENVVFASDDEDAPPIIIDWGDAMHVEEYKMYDDYVGTPFYIAPELFRARKGWEMKKTDMWAVGILTFVLLTGSPPFTGKSNKEIARAIARTKFEFPRSSNASRSAKQFVIKCLKRSTTARISAEDALNLDWLMAEQSNATLASFGELQNFGEATKLQKLLVNVSVHNMSRADKQTLKAAFSSMDSNGSGKVSVNELASFLKLNHMGMTTAAARLRAREIMNAAGVGEQGELNLKGFVKAQAMSKMKSEDHLRQLFVSMDTNRTGRMSTRDLSKALSESFGRELSEKERKMINRQFSKHFSGLDIVTEDDFVDALQNISSPTRSPTSPQR